MKHFSSTYLFEVDEGKFPEPLKINPNEPFLIKCFDFYHEEKKVRTLPECSHDCKNKEGCKHECCKKRRGECVVVEGREREGNKKKYFLLEANEKIEIQKESKRKIEEMREEFHVNTSTNTPSEPKKNPERDRKRPKKFNESS